jgi:hypothetical protein
MTFVGAGSSSGENQVLAFKQQPGLSFVNMNLTQIASADLKRVVALVEQKETLLAQVAQLEAELAGFQSGEPVAPATPAKGKPGRKPGRPAKARTGARGALKAAIIELLTGAGASGLTVQELAAKLKAKPGNVHVWFSSTGKTIKQVKKLGPGKYGWVAASEPVVAPAVAVKFLPIHHHAHLLEAAPAAATKAEKSVVQKAPAQEPKARKAGRRRMRSLNWSRAPERRASRSKKSRESSASTRNAFTSGSAAPAKKSKRSKR